jgi:uncharacterized membrane protein YkvA (DUF1232 family)
VPLHVTFELSDADLDYFRNAMREAREKTDLSDEAAIIAGARRATQHTNQLTVPDFVRARLGSLDAMTRMLEDADWKLEEPHRMRVLQALAYFVDPRDMIPDEIPGVGFLDDAILIELVVQELHPELDAYEAFCEYRDAERARIGVDPEEQRRSLADQRRAMIARIERRREQRERRGGLFSIFR